MRNPFKRRETIHAEGTSPIGTAKDQIRQVNAIIKKHGGEIVEMKIVFECKYCTFSLELKEENADDFSFCPRCGKEDLPSVRDDGL